MNRVQTAFIVLLAAILAADLVLSFVLAAVQGAGFVATARTVSSWATILLLACGLLLAGSTRVSPTQYLQNSPILATPSFGRVLRQDRATQARGVSDYPVVGILYGLILMVLTFFLYLVPG